MVRVYSRQPQVSLRSKTSGELRGKVLRKLIPVPGKVNRYVRGGIEWRPICRYRHAEVGQDQRECTAGGLGHLAQITCRHVRAPQFRLGSHVLPSPRQLLQIYPLCHLYFRGPGARCRCSRLTQCVVVRKHIPGRTHRCTVLGTVNATIDPKPGATGQAFGPPQASARLKGEQQKRTFLRRGGARCVRPFARTAHLLSPPEQLRTYGLSTACRGAGDVM